MLHKTGIFSFGKRGERGTSLIETITGLGIFMMIGVVFISGLATNYKGQMVREKVASGEIIARSCIEYVKNQPFSDEEWTYTVSTANRSSSQQPSWWDTNNPPLLDGMYTGYSAVLTTNDFDADGDEIVEVPGDDEDIRILTAEVYNNKNDLVISVESHKVNR